MIIKIFACGSIVAIADLMAQVQKVILSGNIPGVLYVCTINGSTEELTYSANEVTATEASKFYLVENDSK